MAARSPLATLLRIRRLQKDMARAEALTAQAHALLAEHNATEREASVARSHPLDGNPQAFAASVAAGRALAAEAFAARRAHAEAQAVVQQRLAELAEAQQREDGVERVVERHEEAARAADERKVAAERDDLAAQSFLRRREEP
ncbi:hypothetical protein EV189_0661 [Motilibacter rhizosphaerae]|uniref:Flagellar FliJ protein n=1 Tax=Motilibacter rhizosphaerae TaxID=598652 RepID=A0A4Q7NWN0_9ACTN|nr:hypothetical protein [Motilibacter rhizosphaerae]RZS91420.1 hypothetical protein EV189_0661 [Motilibacter rhizosphaerae]